MRLLFISTFIFSIGFIYSQTTSLKSTTLTTSKFAGTYSYGSNAEKGFNGLVIVYPETDTTILFYFESNLGPPSFNMGSVYGRVRIYGDTGTYTDQPIDQKQLCKCGFKFKKDRLILTFNFAFKNCGLGHGVYMNGEFKQISKKLITGFTNMEGKKYFFNATSPEEYNKD